MADTVVSLGTAFLEGPVWRPDSGDLLVTVVTSGRILRVEVTAGTAETFADTGGGPNGAWPSVDGGILVTQNGGLDLAGVGMASAEPSSPATAGLQHVAPDGTVTAVTGDAGPFRAPNDLFVTAEGVVWFTDPPRYPPPAEPVGRVWRWAPGEPPEVMADGLTYCNGIGLEADGNVVIVEGLGPGGLMRLGADGADRSWLIEKLPHHGDGFAFDVDGNLYVAGGAFVTVVSPSGEVLDELPAPDESAIVTNCCFGGDDLRTLFATVGGADARVLAWPDRPVAGRPLDPAPVPR